MDLCASFGDSRLKPTEASFSALLNVDNFRPEAYSDVISSVVVDPTCVKVCVKTLLEIYDCRTLLRTTATGKMTWPKNKTVIQT